MNYSVFQKQLVRCWLVNYSQPVIIISFFIWEVRHQGYLPYGGHFNQITEQNKNWPAKHQKWQSWLALLSILSKRYLRNTFLKQNLPRKRKWISALSKKRLSKFVHQTLPISRNIPERKVSFFFRMGNITEASILLQ